MDDLPTPIFLRLARDRRRMRKKKAAHQSWRRWGAFLARPRTRRVVRRLSISRMTRSPVGGEIAHPRRGAADCGEYREAPGAIAEAVAAVRRSCLTVALLSLTARTKSLLFPFCGGPVAVSVVIPCAGLPAAAILAD